MAPFHIRWAPNTWTGAERSWNALTYSTGVEHDVFPQSMAYAKFQTGYQPGAIDSMNTTGTSKLRLRQWTLGIKNRFFDNKLQLNIEAFDSLFLNRTVTVAVVELVTNDSTNTTYCPTAATGAVYRYSIVADTSGTLHGCFSYTGTPTIDANSRGVDVELNYLPTSSDRVDLTVEYLRSTYRTAPDIPGYAFTAASVLSTAGITSPTMTHTTAAQTLATNYNTNADAYNGVQLQNAPKWAVNASYQHEFRFAGGSSFTPRISGYYKSVYWTSGGGGAVSVLQANQALRSGTFNASVQKGYSKFDLYSTWAAADGKFTVAGYVKNIENEAIMTNGGGTYVSLDAPRTYGVTLSANF